MRRYPCRCRGRLLCGDADRDGRQEIYAHQRIFEHIGGNRFDSTNTAWDVRSWHLGDLDSDGLRDLLVMGFHLNTLYLLEARDSFSFPDSAVWQDSVTGPGASLLPTVWDWDLDSRLEFTTPRPYGSEFALCVFECCGNDSFRVVTTFPRDTLSEKTGRGFVGEDLDRDGKPELLTEDLWSRVLVYESAGNDSFECVETLQVNVYVSGSGGIGCTDLDGDGRKEAIIYTAGQISPGRILVYECPADDSFELVWEREVTGHPWSNFIVSVGDVDGDSTQEFLISTGYELQLYRCVGPDSFEMFWSWSSNPSAMLLYDINSDGKAELLFMSSGDCLDIWGWMQVGVEEQQRAALDAVQVRPSVVSRGGVVRLDGLADGASVAVVDASGRVVRVTRGDKVRTRGLSVGMYFLRMTAGRSSVLKKLLVVE